MEGLESMEVSNVGQNVAEASGKACSKEITLFIQICGRRIARPHSCQTVLRYPKKDSCWPLTPRILFCQVSALRTDSAQATLEAQQVGPLCKILAPEEMGLPPTHLSLCHGI